jgi:hypothetical protein
MAPPCLTTALLAVGVLLSPAHAHGDMFPTVSQLYGDDLHTSTLNPYPAVLVSTLPSTPPGQSDSINAGVAQFKMDNPADGSGPSGQAWTFDWAGAATEAKVEAGITILDYYPFVVTPPAVTTASGKVFMARPPDEQGGAVLNLKYTPQPGAPAIENLHWIQALAGTRRGAAVPAHLDNSPTPPTTGQGKLTPFYDAITSAAGTLADGGGYFLDRPRSFEQEYESNPVTSLQFQVVLAGDHQETVNGVVVNMVTLYGGVSWGYTYSAVDVPEPSTLLLLTLGGGGLLVFRHGAGRRRAA